MMITDNPALVEAILRCAQHSSNDPTVHQRPVAIRFVSLQALYYIRLAHSCIGGATSSFIKVPLPQSLRVTIIGCGQVGSDVVRTLIGSQIIHPSCITISTRQVSKCIKFKAQGIVCIQNNALAVADADVVILCCLPSQLSSVSSDIAGKMNRATLLVSTCAGVSSDKICSQFHHPYALTTTIVHSDVVTFCKVHPERIDHFVGFPATHALANCSFPFRHTTDHDALAHLLGCLVGFQMHRDRKVETEIAFQMALEAVFSRNALIRRQEAIVGGEATQAALVHPGMSTGHACDLKHISHVLMLSRQLLMDYALQQHVNFVTKFV